MKLPEADLIETHENAIEMLLIIAQQCLEREKLISRTAPGEKSAKKPNDNIKTLQRALCLGHDYLIANGYPKDGVTTITEEYKREEK